MDSEAYERVVMEQKDRLYGYAAMMLRDPAEAQDVAQETLIRLWQHRSRVEAETSSFWLRRTAHNLCIDKIRRRRSRPEVDSEDLETDSPDLGPDPRQLAQSGELGGLIGQALAKLPEAAREVLVLREVQGLAYDEIARMLDLPLGTLKARLHRAREQLRSRLIRQGVTP